MKFYYMKKIILIIFLNIIFFISSIKSISIITNFGPLQIINHSTDLTTPNIINMEGLINIGRNNTDMIFLEGALINTPSNGSINLSINSNGQVITIPSSRDYKKGIELLNIDSNDIDALRPVSFYYKNDENNENLIFGLIAEEVMQLETLKYTVIIGKNGCPFSIDYQSITIALLKDYLDTKKNIKILEKSIEDRDKIIDELITKIKLIEAKIAKIENQINF